MKSIQYYVFIRHYYVSTISGNKDFIKEVEFELVLE